MPQLWPRVRIHSLSQAIKSLLTSQNRPLQHKRGFKMAWFCSGNTNKELIDNLFKNGLITSEKVRDAMVMVDRAHYCPDLRSAYEDSPQPIGHRATISAPHMHAHAAEALLPNITQSSPAARVLDIGSGSGYLTHVLANLVGPQGRVVGVEHISALAKLGADNVRKSQQGKEFLDSGRIKFVVADGRKGYVDEEVQDGGERGWDAIHVGAAALELHEELLQQLKSPGRLFIPVSEPNDVDSQYIWVIDKDENGKIHKKRSFGVRYVPLTDPH